MTARKPRRNPRRGRRRLEPRTILVTGASSGIGAALALRYAGPGRLLLLWGRDRDRLDRVAAECRARGAETRTRSLDLAAQDTVLAALGEDDDATPVSLLILAAGLGDMRAADSVTEAPESVLRLGAVNFSVPAAMATLIGGRMARRGGGRIALIGSVAAFHDLPYAAAYAGSKAGLARFAGALRLGLEKHGVGVVLISPGFVDTPMSRRVRSAKPFLLPVDTAADRMAIAIDRNDAHLLLPWPFAVLGGLSAMLPPFMRRAILRRTRAEPAG
ncbi:SDR family NAD(P)-dependent oxidoreductase [Acetobacteraceae bacterium KSS8]|uniref:SDR family NAD(P)-dependent oxidoreductase n=1 Tax=Endosaccharibacter trunci TaxID=2812733 RepID=A0ABT1W6W2_9PROT|nr:SDR family NAD(P)-dependent oxidoreductase [Acetobacteraceae bacterium KSS8]